LTSRFLVVKIVDEIDPYGIVMIFETTGKSGERMKLLVDKHSKVEALRKKTFSDLEEILPPGTPGHLQTEILAKFLGIQPGTMRRSLCQNGHYAGLVPLKLGNGRLLWPTTESQF
jgi:hypothetical protein